MVYVARGKISIDDLIIENMKARGSDTNNIKTNSEENLVTRESRRRSGRRENRLRKLSLTQSIIDNVRGSERVSAKPRKTSLIELNSTQNLRIPTKGHIETVDYSTRVLGKYDLSGEACPLRRSSTA
jgi:hypothetical protein